METSSPTHRAGTISVVMMLVLASFFIVIALSPTVAANVTTGVTRDIAPSYIRDDSTAIPIFAFGAESDVATDRLSRVEVGLDVWNGISQTELKDEDTDAYISGVAIVRDDGDTDDVFDENDHPVNSSSISWQGGWPWNNIRIDFNALIDERVPSSLNGNYQWFVVIRTDWHIDNGDQIYARIFTNGIDFSDGSDQPSSSEYTSAINVYETQYFDVGDGNMRANDAEAQLGLRILDGGSYEKFDRVTLDMVASSGFTQSDLATITIDAGTSGIALYRNNGNGVWGAGDVEIDCTSVDTSSWPIVHLYPDDEDLPNTPVGSYAYWVVIRTSATIGHNNAFYVWGQEDTIRINGTLDIASDRLVTTPENNNDEWEYIRADTQAPRLTNYYWSESSSYLHWTGGMSGTLWFSNTATWTQSATLVANGVSEDWTGIDYVEFSYEASLDSGGYRDTSPTYLYTYSIDSWDTDASAPITLTMRDDAGNIDTYDVKYAMDTTAPAVTISNPVDLDTVSGIVNIRASATDAQSGVRYTSAQVSWDGWSWYMMPYDGTHFTYNWDTTVLPDGLTRVIVQLRDEVNNLGSARANVYLDNTGPNSYILWPAAGQYMHSDDDMTVVATAIDASPLASMEARLGSGVWTSMTYEAVYGTWRANMGAPGGGTLTIQVRATDSEGNLGPTVTVIAFGDANDPTVTVISHGEGDEVGKTIIIIVDADDAEELIDVKVYLEGTTTMLVDAVFNPATGYYEVTIDTTTLTDGKWAVAAVAWDEAGRYNITTPFNITVDNTEPTLAILTPTSGTFVYGTYSITASSSDSGSGFDTGGLALTIDGGDWQAMTLSGGVWSYSLDTTGLADGAHTIIVGAIDDAGNIAVRTVTIVVDNTQPFVSVISPSANDWIEGTYTFAISAMDNYGIAAVIASIVGPSSTVDVTFGYNAASGYYEWTVDTSAWVDGAYTITPTAFELSGREYNGASSVAFWLDNNDPTLVVMAPLDGEIILNGTYTVNVQAGDLVFGLQPGDVQWRVDANPWKDMNAGTSDWSATWFTTDFADGQHTLTFRAIDGVGHTVTHTVTVTVDNNDPTVSLNTPSVSEYVSGVYTFSARAADTLGIRSVEMHFGFSGPAPLSDAMATYNPSTGYWEMSVDTTTLPDGPATMMLTAFDTSGRMTTSVLYDFAIDNNAPSLLLMSPTPGEIVLDGMMEVLIDAEDDGFDLTMGNVEYNLDATGWIAMGNLSGEPTMWGFDLNTSEMSDGEHTLAFRVTDFAGHVTSTFVNFVVDNTDPTCGIMSPSQGEFVQGTYIFRVSATDALGVASVHLTFEGIPSLEEADANYNPAMGLWEFMIDTSTLYDAEASVSAMATDASGRVSVMAGPADFILDNNAPVISFGNPVEGQIIIEGEITVTVSAVDAFFDLEFGDVFLSIDDGSWMPMELDDDGNFAYDWNTSGLSDGVHNLKTKAEDAAGYAAQVAINVIVDNHLPALAIVSPTDEQFVTGMINFQVSSSDVRDIVRVTLDWGVGNPVFATINTATNYYEHGLDTTTLVDGTYELKAISVDGSGLVSEAMVVFYVDNTEPELVFTGPLTGAILDGEVTVTATATDTFIDTLQFSVDGVGWVDMEDGTGTFDSTLFSDGEHTITVRAIDGSGKVTDTASVVTIDNTAPAISVADFPEMDEHLAGDIGFDLFSEDEVGVMAVTVTIGDETWPVYINPLTGFYEWTLVSTGFDDGSYELEFTSTDAAGHNSSITWFVFVDNTAPVIVDKSPRDKATVQGIVRFEVTTEDASDTASVLLSIGRGPWITMTELDDGTYLYKWETTNEDNDDWEYSVRVTDTLGNTEDTTSKFTVENPANLTWVVLLAVLVALVVLGWFIMHKRDKDEDLDSEEGDELEEITADYDALAGLESESEAPSGENGGFPSSEDIADQVEVELEEKSF